MGSGTLRRVWRIARWVILFVALAVIALAVYRLPYVVQKQQSDELVAVINSRHLNMADVDGKHLPPPPDSNEKDATVEGVDANQNGIRDDVELAIFAKYPNDIKLRAAALQYALTEQMFLTSVIDAPTWKAVAEQSSRAFNCILKVNQLLSIEVSDYVESITLSTADRKVAFERAYEHITSHGSAPGNSCDLDV